MAIVTTQLSIRLLGTPEILAAGVPVVISNHKARALLFYLAATAQPHTRDSLATLLWSETPDSNARHSLRSSLYRLRQALHPYSADNALLIDGDMVQLHLDEDACDVPYFYWLLTKGNESTLAEAISLYRGPLLQGFTPPDAPVFEEWLRFEASRLQQAYVGVLQRLATFAESRQSWDEAVEYIQRLVQLDPLDEAVQQQLIGLYLHMGAIGKALHQYRQLESELAEKLDLTPSAETQALLQEAMRLRRDTAPTVRMSPRSPVRLPPSLPFTGRDDTLEKLLVLSHDVTTGRGVTVLVQGENGIGKSRLLDEFASRLPVEASAWIILQGSCSPFDDLLPYGPFLEAFQSADLGDLTDLLTASQQTSSGEQERLLWRILQALRMLTRNAPILLAIDDLQWANSSTLHLFGLLAARLRTLPVMLIGTVHRAEAIPALQRLIVIGRRHGDVHLISLHPFSLQTLTALLQTLGINPTSAPTFHNWLYERSGGSPFVLAEILSQLRSEGILKGSEGVQLDTSRWLRWRATCSLPATTHDLVSWRFTNLPAGARTLLNVLAVAELPLPAALLQEFPGIQADQLPSLLDDLLERGLVVEVGGEKVALTHHLLRETLLHHLSHLHRRAIHRQLVVLLDACPVLQANFPLRQIALHAVASEDVARARRYGLQVLDELVSYDAHTETVNFLHHLYDLLAPDASPADLLRLTRSLGQAHQSLGQLEQASFWYHQHLALTSASDPLAQAAAYFDMSELALIANDYHAAAEAAQTGLALTSVDEPSQATPFAQGQRLLGAALAMEGRDLAAAERHLQEAVEVQKLNDQQSDLCATLFELGNVAAQRGDLPRALELYEEAARKAEAAHVHYFLALAHNNIAYHSLLLDRPEAARRAAAQGWKLAETYEMFGAMLHLSSTQGEIHLYQGEWTAAAEVFQRGLALAEELGNLERQAGFRAGLALVARGQHDLEKATALLEEALLLINHHGYWHLRTRIQLWLAEILLQRGQLNEAHAYLSAALATAQAHGRELLLIQGNRLHAHLLAANGNWPQADHLFAETLKQAVNLNLPLEVARTQEIWEKAVLCYGPSKHDGRERT